MPQVMSKRILRPNVGNSEANSGVRWKEFRCLFTPDTPQKSNIDTQNSMVWKSGMTPAVRFLGLCFFPNSFSYRAVPGRLPNHGFLEGSGAGSGAMFRDRVPGRFWAGFLGGSRQGSRRDGSRTYWKRSGCGLGDRVPGRFPWWTSSSSSSSTSTSTSTSSGSDRWKVQSCSYVASCWPCRLWRMFWAVSGQFGRFWFRFWKGFRKFNFLTTCVQHVAVTPCNSDVVTANISKHQLTSPSFWKKTTPRRFSLLGILPKKRCWG